MPGYQTDRLEKYPSEFQNVAENLFRKLGERIPDTQIKKYPGSYSVFGTRSKETAAKIVIYHPHVGKTPSDWPRIRDGEYVFVRANGTLASGIWDDILGTEMPEMFARMRRTETVTVAPAHGERFAYFPVMPGDDREEIASLMAACSRV